MSENLMNKVSAFGERLKIGGSDFGRKVKELIQGSNQADKLVEEASSETLRDPDLARNLAICDMINQEELDGGDVIRGIKKRIMMKNTTVQYMALVLLEMCVKNCEEGFSVVASERVLDEIVKLVHDPMTVAVNRNKALMMIEAWGESTSDLRFLPVFEETFKGLKSRGIQFPGRDLESLAPIFTPPRSVPEPAFDADLSEQISGIIPELAFSDEQIKEAFNAARNRIELLTSVLPSSSANQDELVRMLVQHCEDSQYTVQRIIETAEADEARLFEALNLNDDIQKVLSKHRDSNPRAGSPEQEPAMIPITVVDQGEPRLPLPTEPPATRKPSAGLRGELNDPVMDDLDEMIFGDRDGGRSEPRARDPKRHPPANDDLITF